MAIIAQEIDQNHLYIKTSTSQEVTITREQIQEHFSNEMSEDRQSQTLIWLKNQIIAALGSDQIDTTQLFVDFDINTGSPTVLQVGI